MDQGHDGPHGVLELQKPEQHEGDDQGGEHQKRDADLENGQQVYRSGQGRGHHAAEHPLELESARDVDRDEQQGIKHGEQRLFPEVFSHLRPDHFHTADLGVGAGGALQGVAQPGGEPFGGLDGGIGTDQHFVVAFFSEALDGRCGHVYFPEPALDVGDPDRFGKANLDQGAAGKVDTVVGAPVNDKGGQAGQDHQEGDSVGDLPLPDEINVHIRFDELHGVIDGHA